ncbi:MAG: hypothetical protein M1820_001192 [Bogoriella megaspora]|nr:MAG: hypothetical protein M1820_001192 [Bogoriella megaspora]
MSYNDHPAAVITSKGVLEIVKRSTPKPGPGELLIEVKAIALNPIDWKQRDFGFMLKGFPAITGYDIGGIVIDVGSSNRPNVPAVGTRVAAFSNAFFSQGEPNYGGLQKYALVPVEMVTPIPSGISFNEAALFGMQAATTWSAFYTAGLPYDVKASAKQGFLVWGGSGSIGTGGVETAKLQGFTVYATASEKNHAYVKSLGADRVFDYKDPAVVQKIVKAAKEDGVILDVAYDCAGATQEIQDILKEFKRTGVPRLATAIPLNDKSPQTEGVETKFVAAPEDEKAKLDHFSFIFNVWLKDKLERGVYVPGPSIKVIDGGLEAANKALDELKAGVSATKLVLEV